MSLACGLALLALWFAAPLVLAPIPRAPRVAPPLGSAALSAATGAGFMVLAIGVGRVRNWAYVVATAGVWAVALLAGSAALAISRSSTTPLPPAVIGSAVRLFAVPGDARNPELVSRVLREQYVHRLAVVGVAALLMGGMLLGAESRDHYRRNWTPGAKLAALVAIALLLGPLAMLAYTRSHP